MTDSGPILPILKHQLRDARVALTAGEFIEALRATGVFAESAAGRDDIDLEELFFDLGEHNAAPDSVKITILWPSGVEFRDARSRLPKLRDTPFLLVCDDESTPLDSDEAAVLVALFFSHLEAPRPDSGHRLVAHLVKQHGNSPDV